MTETTEPTQKEKDDRANTRNGLIGCGVLILLAVLALTFCSGGDEANHDYALTEEGAAGVNLNLRVEKEFSGIFMLTEFGQLVESIVMRVRADEFATTEETEYIQLQLQVATVDRLGNEGTGDMGTFRIPIADARAANVENLSGFMWLELIDDIELAQFGAELVEPCLDGGLDDNPRFCALVIEDAR